VLPSERAEMEIENADEPSSCCYRDGLQRILAGKTVFAAARSGSDGLRHAPKITHRGASRAFDRVKIELAADSETDSLPLEERLQRVQDGGEDPALVELYFQFGRYC